jgi:hypothetical protein
MPEQHGVDADPEEPEPASTLTGGPPSRRARVIWLEPFHRIQPDELITRPRAMTDEQLLEQRIEWQPQRPCCRSCAHLGEPVAVTDRRHARRIRRRCPRQSLGYTDSNWTACDAYEEAVASSQ